MEYYTSYQKSPEEYCSTMDLKETIDILAPVSVGKKHNVIKITVKKNNRVKDYWLDCDCPSLMNEWVNHIVTVAGLSPEGLCVCVYLCEQVNKGTNVVCICMYMYMESSISLCGCN